MKHVAPLLIVSAFSFGALAGTIESYHSLVGHFSFVLPSQWFPLAPSMVSDHQEAAERDLGHRLSMVLDTVLNRPGDQPFAPPCIQVTMLEHGGMMTEQVFKEKYGVPSGPGQITGAAEEAVRRGLVRTLKTGEPAYDPEKQMALVRGQMVIAGIGETKTVTAMFLGRDVLVLVNLLSKAEDLEEHIGAFEKVISTFRFDQGYAYEPAAPQAPSYTSRERKSSFWSELLVKACIYGTISGFLILAGLISALVAKARKKGKAPGG